MGSFLGPHTSTERFPKDKAEADVQKRADENVSQSGALKSVKSRDPFTQEWIITTDWP
jgi:hypothetical protein